MISAAPTIVALQNDSAWVMVVGVSAVTLALVVLLRRLIARPGGIMSAALLVLPLLLPLVAAAAFQSAVFPEIAMLRPADPSVAGDPYVFFLHAPESQLLIPYRLVGVTGIWLLFVAAAASILMLLRRVVCAAAARRLMNRCVSVGSADEERVAALLRDVVTALDLERAPQVFLLPGDRSGVFCSRRGGGRIFIARQLLECLSDEELKGVLAHEIAHLRVHDTTVTFVAGLLRDMVVWNPVAHVAHRRLLADRELEADRVAASVTGPLPIAAGLVKVSETLRAGRPLSRAGALAFLRPGGRLKKRVDALLALGDGGTAVEPASRAAYLCAALLASVLGLQVAAQLAESHRSFSAIVLGAPSVSSVEVWPTAEDLVVDIKAHRKEAHLKKVRREARLRAKEFRLAAIRGVKPGRPYGFREAELRRWLRAVAALGPHGGRAGEGRRPTMVSQAWRAELPRRGFGPISVVRIHATNLGEKEARPPAAPEAPAAAE